MKAETINAGGSGSSDRVQICVLDPWHGFDAIEAEWRALSLMAERPSCFASPSYFRAWRDTLSDDVEPFLLVARRGGLMQGVMPLMRATVRRGPLCAPRHDFAPSDRGLLGPGKPRPIRVDQLSPIVSMPAAWVGPAPLCLSPGRRQVVRAMASAIAGMTRWQVFALPVDAGDEQVEWLDALRAAGLNPWVLELGRHIGGITKVEPFATIVAQQNRNFRRNIRRAQQAANAAGLKIHVHEGRAEVAPRLPLLAAIAAQSWKQTGRANVDLTVPYLGAQQRFFERLITDPATDPDGTPLLAIATCAGTPVAASLMMLHGDRLTGLVTFCNDQIPEASPGMLVLGRMIDWVAERGLAGFELNATHEWTRRLIDETRTQNIVVCFSRTLRGRALALISATARRLR